MPEMSGWELTEALKANDRSISTIPIVALTAHAMTGDRNRALVMGFHHFMTKPIRPESFIQELFMMLADDLPELRKSLSSE
jgi:CheY-like chemotaxis protein